MGVILSHLRFLQTAKFFSNKLENNIVYEIYIYRLTSREEAQCSSPTFPNSTDYFEKFFFCNHREHESEIHVDLKRLIYHQTTKSSQIYSGNVISKELKIISDSLLFYPKDFELQTAMWTSSTLRPLYKETIYSRVLLNTYRIITSRKTRDIGLDAFREDICCVFSKESVDDLDDVITAYDNTLRIMTSTPQNTDKEYNP